MVPLLETDARQAFPLHPKAQGLPRTTTFLRVEPNSSLHTYRSHIFFSHVFPNFCQRTNAALPAEPPHSRRCVTKLVPSAYTEPIVVPPAEEVPSYTHNLINVFFPPPSPLFRTPLAMFRDLVECTLHRTRTLGPQGKSLDPPDLLDLGYRFPPSPFLSFPLCA